MDGNYKLASSTNEEIVEHFKLDCSVQTLLRAFKKEKESIGFIQHRRSF